MTARAVMERSGAMVTAWRDGPTLGGACVTIEPRASREGSHGPATRWARAVMEDEDDDLDEDEDVFGDDDEFDDDAEFDEDDEDFLEDDEEGLDEDDESDDDDDDDDDL